MKKKYILFSAVLSLAYLALTSYNTGPALFGLNRTGAQATATTCNGGGCHGTGTATTVTLTLDSGTVSTTHYKPGHSYTLKIHGTNTSGNPQFGFECATVSGTGATQVQAGAFSSLPTSTGTDALGGLSILEHHAPLAGSPAGTYDETVTWTAPPSNVGNITVYCTINAVDGDGLAGPGDISGNTSLVLTPVNTTETPMIATDRMVVVYPNPAINFCTVSVQHATAGTYSLFAMNMAGSRVYEADFLISDGYGELRVPTATWMPGLYFLTVTGADQTEVVAVVKE